MKSASQPARSATLPSVSNERSAGCVLLWRSSKTSRQARQSGQFSSQKTTLFECLAHLFILCGLAGIFKGFYATVAADVVTKEVPFFSPIQLLLDLHSASLLC